MYVKTKYGDIYRISPDSIEEHETPVIVIPVAQWRRLVELWESVSSTCFDDAALDHAEELEAIIASVEVDDA